MVGSIQAIESNTTRTEAELAGLLDQTRHIAMDERKAQQRQLADVHSLTSKAGKLLDDADVSVQQLGESAKSLSGVGPAVMDAVNDTSQQVESTLAVSQSMMKAATLDLLDPNIQKSLDNISSATAYVASTTANLDASTRDIRDYVHRETTPVRGTWNFLKRIINLTWSLRGATGL